jgi:lambda repressor-like predicted transcriptional regulator
LTGYALSIILSLKDEKGRQNMNKLSIEKRSQIVRCLVDGNSLRATSRIAGSSKNTITKLLVDFGQACSNYQDEHIRNIKCERIQVDEIWSFCYAKRMMQREGIAQANV